MRALWSRARRRAKEDRDTKDQLAWARSRVIDPDEMPWHPSKDFVGHLTYGEVVMSAIRIDESRFPLVLVTFPVSASDAEFGEYLKSLSRLLGRRAKIATIFDISEFGPPAATQRAKQAEWLKVNREVLRQYSCGSAFVIHSPVVRGALTAILWVSPMPVEHVIVTTLRDAERWTIDRLTAAGVSLPPAKTPSQGRSP